MIIYRFGYLVKEGFKSVFTHGFMSLACIIVIVACLLIMGNFALLALNIDYNIDELESQNEILAYVDEDLSEEQARELYLHLRSIENVSSVQFITRQEALETFINKYENTEQFSDLPPDTTLRNRYVIFLEDLSRMAETKARIEAVEGIADVGASLQLSQGVITVRNIVSLVSVILIVILFVVSVFIMQKTIKLATFSRREEIAIMKIVGATNSFIRGPFVIEGLLLGVVGGAAAFCLQWGIYTLITDGMARGSISSFVSVIPFAQLRSPLFLVFLLVGLAVGTFGSNMAIRNYLKV